MLIEEREIIEPLEIKICNSYLLDNRLTHLEAADYFFNLTDIKLTPEKLIELIYLERLNVYWGSGLIGLTNKSFKELEKEKPLHYRVITGYAPPHYYEGGLFEEHLGVKWPKVLGFKWPKKGDKLFRAVKTLYLESRDCLYKTPEFLLLYFDKTEIENLAQQTNNPPQTKLNSTKEKSALTKSAGLQVQREEAIFKAIKDLGYHSKKLPPYENGKKGIKSQIKETLKDNELFAAKNAFDKTWQHLLAADNEAIKYREK